jgi:hypothetical protein
MRNCYMHRGSENKQKLDYAQRKEVINNKQKLIVQSERN